MTKRAYKGMICGQAVDMTIQGVMLPKKQVRAIRLIEPISATTWQAIVRTGKHRGQSVNVSSSDIIVFKDRDGSI